MQQKTPASYQDPGIILVTAENPVESGHASRLGHHPGDELFDYFSRNLLRRPFWRDNRIKRRGKTFTVFQLQAVEVNGGWYDIQP
jgi:hypothetical protein